MAQAAPPTSALAARMWVFQVCDSTFPIGTFNHSFGMERYLHERRITNTAQFERWLESYVDTQFTYGEGLACLLSYSALDQGFHEKLWEYDEVLHASALARETREGNELIAWQMLKLIRRLHECGRGGASDEGKREESTTLCAQHGANGESHGEYVANGPLRSTPDDDHDSIAGAQRGSGAALLEEYARRIERGELSGAPAVVFSIFAHGQKIARHELFVMYGYSIASTLVQNAVRAVPLGQSDGQIVLARVIDRLEHLCDVADQLDESYLGANAVGIELAQILHETQGVRLFMS